MTEIWLLTTYHESELGRVEESVIEYDSEENAKKDMKGMWEACLRKQDAEFCIVDEDSYCGTDEALVSMRDGTAIIFEVTVTNELIQRKK